MYCKSCGSQMDDAAVVCVKCGVPREVGNRFCHRCGHPSGPDAVVCVGCGVPLYAPQQAAYPAKSRVCAGLLGIFLGALGVHNFYLGYTGKAVAQLLITLLSFTVLSGISALWGLIEGILLLCGSIATDGNGLPLRD